MSITTTLVAFSLAATLLTLTPGLDTALVLRTAIVEGRKSAFHVALGINSGCYFWGTMVAFGLGALLATSHLAYDMLKWLGGGYLCWLAGHLLLSRPQPFSLPQKTVSISRHNGFWRGCLGNVLNPKVGVFYVSFLPQFIPTGQSPVVWTFLLVSIHVILGSLWSTVLISIAAKAARFLQQPSVIQWMNRVTAGVFIVFAAKLVLSSH